MKRITTFVWVIIMTTLVSNGQLIINHRYIDITKLTETEINLAKKTLHIAYGHTSHGSQLITGMDGLISFANGGGKGMSFPDNIFAWNEDGSDGALDLDDYAYDSYGGFDLGNPDRETWARATHNYLDDHTDVNVVMWSWCGQMGWASEEEIDTSYLELMNQLETDFPKVKFVYMTGHLDGTGTTGTHYQRAQQIRNYCVNNHKILYDFADIESYDPDTLTNYMMFNASDNCDCDSSGNSFNWATRWQSKHTQDVDWYYCEPAHSQALNGNQKAYAAWRMFAEIARIIATEEVPAEIIVSDTIVSTGETACFDATDTITVAGDDTSVEFQSGSSVDLIAGAAILLKPGFHAYEGSSAHAYITSSSQYCYSLASSAVQSTEKSTVLNDHPIRETEKDEELSLKVYPNPNNGNFIIDTHLITGVKGITIYNQSGKEIYQLKSTDNKQVEIQLSQRITGLYHVRVFDGKHYHTQKIIIY